MGTDLKAVLARGAVSVTWSALVERAIQRLVPDLIEPDELAGGSRDD